KIAKFPVKFPVSREFAYRPFARRPWSIQHFDLAIVHMLEDLPEIAHVKPMSADRAFHEMIGLGLSDTIRVNAGLDHASSPMTSYSNTTPSGSFTTNHSSARSEFANTLRWS